MPDEVSADGVDKVQSRWLPQPALGAGWLAEPALGAGWLAQTERHGDRGAICIFMEALTKRDGVQREVNAEDGPTHVGR